MIFPTGLKDLFDGSDYALPGGAIIIAMEIMLIIMAIIMAGAMDTTAEPDTKSAGVLLKMFSNFAVFIFSDPVKRCKKKKLPAAGSAERFENLFYFLSTTTSRAAINNNGGNNNNAVNVVEKVVHKKFLFFQNIV